MQRLAIVNEKGGVGKTLIATQLAFYASLQKQKRVLVIDFDQQANTTHCLQEHASCTCSSVSLFDVLTKGTVPPERGNLLLIPATQDLMSLERRTDFHRELVQNLMNVIKTLESDFDFAIFDTNPSPDIRAVSALALASHVIIPVQLNREALDGVSLMFKKLQGAKRINPKMEFLGLLPNLVEKKPFQIENFKKLVQSNANLLLKDDDGNFMKISSATALAEAQSESRPVWEGEKSTSAKTWKLVQPVFETLLKRMNCD